MLAVPEAPLTGHRPPLREGVLAGLPEAEAQVVAAQQQFRTSVLRDIHHHAAVHGGRLSGHLDQTHLGARQRLERARPAGERKSDPAESEGPALAAVARYLGRELTASEQIMARQLLRQDKSPAQIADVLRSLP